MRKINELTEEELKSFLDDYYHSEESVKEIIKKHSINTLSSKIKKELPDVAVSFICPRCGSIMFEQALSRTEYLRQLKYEIEPVWSYRKSNIFCKECGHQDTKEIFNKDYCDCPTCKILKRQQEEEKRKEASEKFENITSEQRRNATSLSDISNIKDYTLLLSIFMYLYEENFVTQPISRLSTLGFAPTINTGFSYIKYFINRGAIGFDDMPNNTNLVTFSKEDKDKYSYHPYDMKYKLLLRDIEEYTLAEIVSMCENPKYYPFIKEEALEMWKEIAKDELLEFLYSLFEKYNFNTEYIGEAVTEKLDVIIEDFSVSEGMVILYTAVTGAASYKQTGISHKHAVNSINSSIATNIAKRKSGEWDTKGYKRNYNLPQSAISITFFENILKIGEKGFTSIPRIEHIPDFFLLEPECSQSKTDYLIYRKLKELIDKLEEEELIPVEYEKDILRLAIHDDFEKENGIEHFSKGADMMLDFIGRLKLGL